MRPLQQQSVNKDVQFACNKFAGPTYLSLRPGSKAVFEEMSWRRQHCVRFDWPEISKLRPPAPETNASPLDQLASVW